MSDLTLGAEEEFHVVDLRTRELVPCAADILDRLPADSFAAELHRSVVETNAPVCTTLDELRDQLTALREQASQTANLTGLGLVAAGTVPLVDPTTLEVTPTSRYRRMLDEYQVLAREQLICGAQVHVGVPDRDLAVALAGRVAPWLPVLLALSASSPFWMGEDTGYASFRSLIWQRWPTAGDNGGVRTAAEHDALVADLIASGTIEDPGMIYFDVRPSAHVPTVELRIPDACPDVDDVVLLAGLFRALIRRERESVDNGVPAPSIRTPVMRAAMWRAARSGLEGQLMDLPHAPAPVAAGVAVAHLIEGLRPYLDEDGDTAQVLDLADRALRRGSMAAVQRRALDRRGRLADVVDLLVARTRGHETGAAYSGVPVVVLPHYARAGDEVFADGMPDRYAGIITVLDQLGPVGLRRRETARDEEQRANGVTFSVAGEASTRLFPVDLVPRVIDADEWAMLGKGLAQRALALDAFLRDVYGERAVVADGVLPAEVVAAAPGLRPTGALVPRTARRVHVAGMDLVRDGTGWRVLEDNLRVPSGIGYAIQNRRLGRAVLGELPLPPGLLSADEVPALLRATLASSSPVDDPTIVVLSAGTSDSAWFEHRMLAEEMGVPVVPSNELFVDDRTVYMQRAGSRTKVDVIYLRIDEDSLLHAPGLDGMPLGPAMLAAIYSGTVTIANALGNGVADDKAIYAYVSRFVEYYLGEKPLLDQVPTYLCAVPEERDLVLARLDSLVCKPVDGYGGDRVVIGPDARDDELDAVRRQILAAPHRWVAQEVVQLSTCPVFDGAELSPRHVDLRAFVFTGGDDIPVVAPAALTRVAPDGSMIVNSSRGGGSKDTWLLSHTPQ